MTNPLVHPHEPTVVVESACAVGEGALWDHRTGTLFFVDIKNPAVWRYRPDTGESSRTEVAERIGFVALTSDPDIVLAGFKTGLVRLHLFGGQTQPLVSPEPDATNNRINDGHAGVDGSVYFGTMDDMEEEPTGTFWRYDGRALKPFGQGPFIVTNGPAISHDNQILYATDTSGGTIYAHDLTDGVPGEGRRFVQFQPDWGHPDGMAVDAEGYVWVCHWGGSRISRFAPDGSIERVLPLPTPQVTKCAFGGTDLTTLYITTAAIGLDDPLAGHVFAVETEIRGLNAHMFEG